jgi:hypothetical protein
MDKIEARKILAEQLTRYKARSYSELARLVAARQVDAFEATGEGGTVYQLEIQCFWDDRADGDIRVMGSIDDGGWRAFVPITDGFMMTPEGKLAP